MTLSNYNYFSSSLPGFSVMDRYISRELIMPFLFGMGLFTSLGIAIGTLFDLVRKVTESGLILNIAIKVLLLKMPEFIVLAFPMAVLLASLMAYSRLSSDSELIALRSVGVNIYRLVVPAIIFSLLITIITFFFNNFVAPAANYQATITLENALNEEDAAFKEENIFYPEYRKVEAENGEKRRILSRLFYAEQFNGKEMQGLTILDRSQVGVNQIVTAQSAICDFGENTCDFFNGTIYLIAPDGSYRNIVRFERQKLQLPKTPLNLGNKGRDYNEMNLVQAYEYLNILSLSGDEKKVRKLRVRIQEKIALPFVCLVMGILGTAMGCRPQNKGKATSFGICVVVIFSYYLLAFLTSSMGIIGIVSPFLAAWLPNFFGFTAGGLLLFKAAS